MRQLNEEILIFTPYKTGVDSAVNLRNYKNVLETVKSARWSYKEVFGSYEGVKEKSILVINRPGVESAVKKLCRDYKQDSYLKSYNDRATSLIFQDNSEERIGTLQPVDRTTAIHSPAYTYDPTDDKYWIAR